jgi:hypothetical protein
VLAAEGAWQRDDPALARRLLAQAATLPPPAITLGGELALDRATSLMLLLRDQASSPDKTPGRDDMTQQRLGPDEKLDLAVLALSSNWTRTLVRADNRSLSLSVAETGRMSPDLEQAPWLDRVRWLLRYLMSRARYTRIRTRRPIVFTLAKESLMSESVSLVPEPPFMRRYLAVTLLALMLIVAVAQLIWVSEVIRSPEPIVWLGEGTVLAMIFLAIGAFAAASVYRDQVVVERQRADAAQAQARDFHEAAMKGRALAAVLKADALVVGEETPDKVREICLRHAAVADELNIFNRRVLRP